MKKIIQILLILIFAINLFAENVQWANKVVKFSSEYSNSISSANQILGKPSVMSSFGYSPCSWMPKPKSGLPEEFIVVGFENPMEASQIIICENTSSGNVNKVFLYDPAGAEHLVYNVKMNYRQNTKGKTTNVFINKTTYKVSQVKLALNDNKYNNLVQIDAVGISDSEKPIVPRINSDSDTLFVSAPEKLDSNINSEFSESAPIISQGGKILFFTRDGHPENFGYARKQDVWYSKIIDGKFEKAMNIGYPINNDASNFAVSTTPDGYSLVLGNIYNADGTVSPGVSVSYWEGNSWTFPKKLDIKNYYNLVNVTGGYCLSSDGKVMLSSINRNDSYGGLDLYFSLLQNDGSWSEPVNLGPTINTAADETSPFIAADGVSLYFSTSGFPGYGLNDMFVSRRDDNTWKKWSEPENMGSGINTSGNDGFYTIPASGDYAYFVSNSSTNNDDIYRVLLPDHLKPKEVVLISGKVFNAKTKEPVHAKIVYENLSDGRELGEAISNASTGEYTIILPYGEKYGFLAEAENFISVNENIDLRNIGRYTEMKKDLFIVPIEVGQSVRLNNIFFEYKAIDLLTDSYSELNRVVKLLNENPEMKIEIGGHTDDIAGDAYNDNLSKNRAKSVADYLIKNGINTTRLKIKGYGKRKPLATNQTEEGRAQNRRVEFIILKK